MGASIPALVTPSLLEWARVEGGFTLELAAERTGFPPEKLRAWETGEATPTLRQAEKLAKVYHRPFGVFSLPQPPVTTPLAAEYRRLPGVKPGEESPELRLALRQMIFRRGVALNLVGELGEQTGVFELRAHLREKPEAVGLRLREALGIPVADQLGWRDEFVAWRAWRAAVERLGVLVFQFPKVDLDQARGVCVLHFPIPAIGVNGREIPLSKPFTLLHELVHLMLANAAEEKPASEERRPESAWREVEQFAERVSSAVLMPGRELLADPFVVEHGSSAHWSVEEVRRISRRYKVTPTALATRLLNMNRLTPASYAQWKRDWQAWQEAHPARKGGGIASPAEKALGRNGRTFTSLVLEALSLDRITAVEASRFLELNFPHIETLRRDLVFARGFEPTTEGAG